MGESEKTFCITQLKVMGLMVYLRCEWLCLTHHRRPICPYQPCITDLLKNVIVTAVFVIGIHLHGMCQNNIISLWRYIFAPIISVITIGYRIWYEMCSLARKNKNYWARNMDKHNNNKIIQSEIKDIEIIINKIPDASDLDTRWTKMMLIKHLKSLYAMVETKKESSL